MSFRRVFENLFNFIFKFFCYVSQVDFIHSYRKIMHLIILIFKMLIFFRHKFHFIILVWFMVLVNAYVFFCPNEQSDGWFVGKCWEIGENFEYVKRKLGSVPFLKFENLINFSKSVFVFRSFGVENYVPDPLKILYIINWQGGV